MAAAKVSAPAQPVARRSGTASAGGPQAFLGASAAPANQLVELLLTCISWQQAQQIADHLFERCLISAAELVPISGKLPHRIGQVEATAVKLILQCAGRHVDSIRAELGRLHTGGLSAGGALRTVPVIEELPGTTPLVAPMLPDELDAATRVQ